MLIRDTSRHREPNIFLSRWGYTHASINCKKTIYLHSCAYIAISNKINFKAETLLEIETFYYGRNVNLPERCKIQTCTHMVM